MRNVNWTAVTAIVAFFILAIVAMFTQPWVTPDQEIGEAEQRIVATMAANANQAVEGASEAVAAASTVVFEADQKSQELAAQRQALILERENLEVTVESQEGEINSLEAERARLEGQLESAQAALEQLGITPESLPTAAGNETATPQPGDSTAPEPEATSQPGETAEATTPSEGDLPDRVVWVLDDQVSEALARAVEADPRFEGWVARAATNCTDFMRLSGTPSAAFFDYSIAGGIDGTACYALYSAVYRDTVVVGTGSVNSFQGRNVTADFNQAGIENVVIHDKQSGNFAPYVDFMANLLGLGEAE